MADLRCTVCGEPWDMDELHEVQGKTYTQALNAFRRTGCEVFNTSHGMVDDEDAGDAAAISAALFDIFGDDVDAIAGELADLGY